MEPETQENNTGVLTNELLTRVHQELQHIAPGEEAGRDIRTFLIEHARATPQPEPPPPALDPAAVGFDYQGRAYRVDPPQDATTERRPEQWVEFTPTNDVVLDDEIRLRDHIETERNRIIIQGRDTPTRIYMGIREVAILKRRWERMGDTGRVRGIPNNMRWMGMTIYKVQYPSHLFLV